MKVQLKAPVTVRAAAILTGSYVATTATQVKQSNQAVFLIDFTLGSLTSMLVKVQYSSDGTNFYDEPYSDTSSATISSDEAQVPLRSRVHVFDTTSAKYLAVPLKTNYVRLAVKGVGVATSSSCTVTLLEGVI